MGTHQFTGIWRKWQDGYNPKDSQSRDAFLTANLTRTLVARTAILERAIKQKQAEAGGSLVDQQQAGEDAEMEARAESETEAEIETVLSIAQFAELRSAPNMLS